MNTISSSTIGNSNLLNNIRATKPIEPPEPWPEPPLPENPDPEKNNVIGEQEMDSSIIELELNQQNSLPSYGMTAETSQPINTIKSNTDFFESYGAQSYGSKTNTKIDTFT